ncbi:MAG: BlaI/MecI/CopY family transcriptional regulator [Longimicrobiales bacterium]
MVPRSIEPTRRELAILKVLWERDEASVREVHEALRHEIPIVQNTVQAFLRTMESKGLVAHRVEGRTFIYRPGREREQTSRRLLSGILDRVFDGALDQLVESALALRAPTPMELKRLRELVERSEGHGRPTRVPKRGRS